MVETTASQLYNYATVASKNIADDCKYSISDITDFEPYVEDFNKVLNAEVWILGSDFNLKYSSDGSDLNSDSSKSIIISNFDPSDYQNGGHYQISNMYNIFKTDMLHVVHPIKSGS